MCRYIELCPSKSGICHASEPSEECVFPLLMAYKALKEGEVVEYRDGPITIILPKRT